MDEVQHSVAQSLPAGSSEEDVERFCQENRFAYIRKSAAYGEAARPVSGCKWEHPVILLRIDYGPSGRVQRATVQGIAMLP